MNPNPPSSDIRVRELMQLKLKSHVVSIPDIPTDTSVSILALHFLQVASSPTELTDIVNIDTCGKK